jgi:hypothetical protein
MHSTVGPQNIKLPKKRRIPAGEII